MFRHTATIYWHNICKNVTSFFSSSFPSQTHHRKHKNITKFTVWYDSRSHNHIKCKQCGTVFQWNLDPHSQLFIFNYTDSFNAWRWKSFLLFKCRYKCDVHESASWYNYESNQQDATIQVNLLFLVSSTCFGRCFRPSSGALGCIYSIW
jgi:hypothetical protein